MNAGLWVLLLTTAWAASARPISKDEPRTAVDVPAEQQQRIGLKIAKVEQKDVEHVIRTVGTITADQRREAHVHVKLNGWIDRIYADYIGKPIQKGQALFEFYSPDLVSTQEEYIAASRQASAGADIAKAALERLKLWGVPDSELDRLQKSRTAKRTITLEAPVGGYIVNKTAIHGMYVTPEMELYHIADLSNVWVIVTLYESDVASIAVGDEAQVQLPYDGGKPLVAKISYVYPEIDVETRTAKARIEVANPGQKLKPGMFANVEITKKLGQSLLVPEDAVIDTGVRRIVFVQTAPARFEPREVRVGPRMGNQLSVLSGLKAGDQVVTSANFLIDAESKFQAALEKSGGAPAGGAGHGGH